MFESPDFTSLYSMLLMFLYFVKTNDSAALAYCSSISFPGKNLPNVIIQIYDTRLAETVLIKCSTTIFDKKMVSKMS
jgi:hypothetical protein